MHNQVGMQEARSLEKEEVGLEGGDYPVSWEGIASGRAKLLQDWQILQSQEVWQYRKACAFDLGTQGPRGNLAIFSRRIWLPWNIK